MRPKAIDLFCGVGGFSLGMEMAGFEVTTAIDIDEVHCSTYRQNFPQTDVYCSDIDSFDFSVLAKEEIDLVFGGPPCQSFSVMGKHDPTDKRGDLLSSFFAAIKILQPKYFVMENVPGLLNEKHEHILTDAIALVAKDYKLTYPISILNAKDYGVSQNRKRIFVLGSRKGLKQINYPEKLETPPLTVREVFDSLPIIALYPELFERDWIDYACDTHLFNTGHFGYKRSYSPNIITGCARTKHTTEVINRFAKTQPGKREPISRCFRLDLNGISNTLRAGTPRANGRFTANRPIHPNLPRVITVREGARLHSYPDWFRFHPTKWHGFRQVGNSVPPLLAKYIGLEAMKALGINPEKDFKTFLLLGKQNKIEEKKVLYL